MRTDSICDTCLYACKFHPQSCGQHTKPPPKKAKAKTNWNMIRKGRRKTR